MRFWLVGIAGGIVGLTVGGCGPPDDIIQTAAPGEIVTPTDPAPEKAEARGEMAAPDPVENRLPTIQLRSDPGPTRWRSGPACEYGCRQGFWLEKSVAQPIEAFLKPFSHVLAVRVQAMPSVEGITVANVQHSLSRSPPDAIGDVIIATVESHSDYGEMSGLCRFLGPGIPEPLNLRWCEVRILADRVQTQD